MILTQKNFDNTNVQNYCVQFCQILQSLNSINGLDIYLSGSVVRNWIALCHFYNFDPFNPSSFEELLKFKETIVLNPEIEIQIKEKTWFDWVFNRDNYSLALRYLVNILTEKNFCVEVSPIHKDSLSCRNVQLNCVKLVGSKNPFVIRIYRMLGKKSFDFDVNSIMAECGKESDKFILINTSFWFQSTDKWWNICNRPGNLHGVIELLEKCIKKESSIVYSIHFSPVILTKRKVIESYEKILVDDFIITNSPVLSFDTTVCENKDTCSICQVDEDITRLVLTKCNHLFHMKCIFEWWNTDTASTNMIVNCPNCRSTFPLIFDPV